MIRPIKIRLTINEVMAIGMIMEAASKAELRPDIANETIILAENYHIWLKRLVAFQYSAKPKSYSIPASLARILHSRIQQIPRSYSLQEVLGQLDQELTNIGLKPSKPIPIL